MNHCDVVVIGDFMLDIDYFYKQEGLSPDFNVPNVVIERKENRPGGAGATVEMLRLMGIKVASLYLEGMFSEKIRIFIDDECKFRISSDCEQKLSIEAAFNVAEQVKKLNPKYIIVSDYGKGMVTRELFERLLDLNIQILVDPAKNKTPTWYIGAYAYVPNKVEAGVSSIQEAIQRSRELLDFYPNVLIKLGSEGMIATSHTQLPTHIEAFPIEVVDTCGAGDMVIAALTVGLLQKMNWIDACNFANKMAAKKCQQFGASPVQIQEDSICK